MSVFALRLGSRLGVALCLLCCGCTSPTLPGGDDPVWHDVTIQGSAEIISVMPDAPDGTEVSIQLTYDDGIANEKPLEGLKLASILNLPTGYQPKIGDKIRLQMDLHYKRKMSVGPPDYLHSEMDKRVFTCLEIVESEPTETPIGAED